MSGKHKKNVYCTANMHNFVGNQCIECGDYQDYLFAPESWYRGFFIGTTRGKKRHKK